MKAIATVLCTLIICATVIHVWKDYKEILKIEVSKETDLKVKVTY